MAISVLTTLQGQIAVAKATITDAQQTALTEALRSRDFKHGIACGIYAAGDEAVLTSEASYYRAAQALEQARTTLRQLERQQQREVEESSARAAQAEQQRRRLWVEEHCPALLFDLTQAQIAEADLRSTPYVSDSPTGQHAMRALRHRVLQAEQAIAEAPAAD